MITERKLKNVQTPEPHQGFLGTGHIARALIHDNFTATDPFILLMDDRVVVPPGNPVGGPHPHAGFETVSLILEGKLGDGPHGVKAGDFELMTAGSGIVHTESIEPGTTLRVLQMWLTLPGKDRWTAPRLQRLRMKSVPRHSGPGLDILVYSGSFAGLSSPVRNHVPLVIADIHLRPDAVTRQHLPASYRSFLYVLQGSVAVGEEHQALREGQVGWLSDPSGGSDSQVTLTGGPSGGRLILYAGEPQHDRIVSHGPFIGDRQQDIVRLYDEYRQGKMSHVLTLKAPQLVNL